MKGLSHQVESSTTVKSLRRQFSLSQINQYTVQLQSCQTVDSPAKKLIEVQLESSHPVHSSARVKSTNRLFRQSQVTQTVHLRSITIQSHLKAVQLESGQSLDSLAGVNSSGLAVACKSKMQVKINCKKIRYLLKNRPTVKKVWPCLNGLCEKKL